jgi:hypothetical protein
VIAAQTFEAAPLCLPLVAAEAKLARVEDQIALQTLFARMPDLRLTVAPEEITW